MFGGHLFIDGPPLRFLQHYGKQCLNSDMAVGLGLQLRWWACGTTRLPRATNGGLAMKDADITRDSTLGATCFFQGVS